MLISVLETIRDNGVISKDECIDIGFSLDEIYCFVLDGFLKPISDELFSLTSVDELFYYATKKCPDDEDFIKKIMDICYAIDRYNTNVNLWFLNNSIEDENLAVFREHLENLEKVYSCNKENSKDINFLYLLMTKAFNNVDYDTIKRVKELSFGDISVDYDNPNYQQPIFENSMRRAIYENYTIEADIKNDRKFGLLSRITVFDSVSSKLIKKANTRYKMFDKEIMAELEKGNYEAVKEFLLKKQELGQATRADLYTLKVLDAYLEISETLRIPKYKIMANASIYNHIDNNDFKRAFMSYKTNNPNDILFFMLKKINELIDSILDYRKEKKDVCTTLDDAISAIYMGDYQAINEYLQAIDMEEYYCLVRDTIMLCVMEDDQTFTKAIDLVMDLSHGNFTFDSKKHIDLYNEAIYNKKFKKAKLYYDMLENSQAFILNPGLKEILVEQYERVNGKNIGSIVVDEEYGLLSVKNYVRLKIKELANGKSIVVLPHMEYEKSKEVYEMITHFDNVICFTIEDEGKWRVVLRKKKSIDDFVNISQLIENFQTQYVFHNNREALEYGRELLAIGKPNPGIYGKCGLILYYLGEYNEAIDCLTVANAMNRRKGWATNYDTLLEQCKKRRRQSFQSKFGGSFKELFKSESGLINSLIELSRDGDFDIKEAVEKLGLDMEKISYAKLVYARDCYADGDFELGDKYLREVIKSRDKSDLLKLLIKNIRTNRLFYCHRKNQHMNCLVIKR